MKGKTFAIMGATGHIGHIICEDLLKRGHSVRAIGRDVNKMSQLHSKGADLVICEFDDLEILKESFKDAYAVFSLIPPAYQEIDYYAFENRVSEVIVEAIEWSGVKRIVNLSSIGADMEKGNGPIAGLYCHEQRLNQLSHLKTLIHLRPSYFMENLNQYLPMIFTQGVIQSPLDPHLPLSMVATRDIGWKAADFLDSTAEFPHLVFEFIGPREVTMEYATEVLANYMEMPELYYQQISYEQAAQGLLEQGLSKQMAGMFIELYKGLNSKQIWPSYNLSLTHCGSTTLEAYLLHLAHKHYAPMHG